MLLIAQPELLWFLDSWQFAEQAEYSMIPEQVKTNNNSLQIRSTPLD